MMIPKTIYELLPYGYMSAGVAEIGYFKTLLSTGSGLLFFMAGAFVWVLRSNNRRTDPESTRKLSGKTQGIYELKPFILIMIGVLLMTWMNYWVVTPLAAVVVMFGIYILFLRLSYRSKRVSFSRNSL